MEIIVDSHAVQRNNIEISWVPSTLFPAMGTCYKTIISFFHGCLAGIVQVLTNRCSVVKPPCFGLFTRKNRIFSELFWSVHVGSSGLAVSAVPSDTGSSKTSQAAHCYVSHQAQRPLGSLTSFHLVSVSLSLLVLICPGFFSCRNEDQEE